MINNQNEKQEFFLFLLGQYCWFEKMLFFLQHSYRWNQLLMIILFIFFIENFFPFLINFVVEIVELIWIKYRIYYMYRMSGEREKRFFFFFATKSSIRKTFSCSAETTNVQMWRECMVFMTNASVAWTLRYGRRSLMCLTRFLSPPLLRPKSFVSTVASPPLCLAWMTFAGSSVQQVYQIMVC